MREDNDIYNSANAEPTAKPDERLRPTVTSVQFIQLQQQFELLVNSVADYAIYMMDLKGRVISWNQGAQNILGFPEDEVLGRHFSVFYEDGDIAIELPEAHLDRVNAEGRLQSELWQRRSDGTVFWAEILISPVLDTPSGLVGYSVVTRDMTTQRRAEQEHHQLEAMRQADALKDQFLSILSHELRTPINAITGFGSILEDELMGPLNADQHNFVSKMLKGADLLLVLVNDLLDMSRIQAGKLSLEPLPMDITQVTRDVVDNLQALAMHKDLDLELELPDEPVMVTADAQRISQVLINFLNNAIKFTPAGGLVKIKVCRRNGYVRCEVADTGIGIRATDLPLLFQRFSQVDMSNTRNKGGTGLGLSIAKALIEAHDGEIGVESQIDRGSTFWFTLPV